MKFTLSKKINKQKGFVLLFSVLVSSLVLSVGISIISIALKQVVLSGSGRDSQFAFYTANTGAECALYWDLSGDITNKPVFATSNQGVTFDVAEVKCLDSQLAVDNTDRNSTCTPNISSDTGWCIDTSANPSIIKTKFRISYDKAGNNVTDKPYCADVIVTKEIVQSGPNAGLVGTTTVTSRGYNTCDSANPRRIERALEFSY
jgi:Tfp pilus assembly protein PilX